MSSTHYDREQKYWDGKGTQDYVSLSPFDQQRILRWIAAGSDVRTCLDLGGGSGMTAKMLATSGIEFLTCMDISAHMLRHSGLPSVQADALKLPFADASFDLIVAAAFLHHVPGLERQVLMECARVLKPGGRIVGYDPSARCIQNKIFMGKGRFRLKSFSPDEQPIDPDYLEATLAQVGLKEVDLRLFSFRNARITPFEAVQRWILDPLSIGPLRNLFQRWFFWSAERA